MYHKHHTKGMVLASRIEGADSLRLLLLTCDLGLINAKVQGGRDIKSKMRNGAQDFSIGEFSILHGRYGWKVVSVRAEKNIFELLKNSPKKLKIISNVSNLVKKLLGEEDISDGIFDIVVNFFGFLEKAKDDEVALAECLVLLKILHKLGYLREDPEFSIKFLTMEINSDILESLAPKRTRLVSLINDSLKVVDL